MSHFDAIKDPAIRREAKLFTAGLLTGSNIAVVIMHGLVAKGIFSPEAARSLLNDAQAKCETFDLPGGYDATITAAFEAFKKGF